MDQGDVMLPLFEYAAIRREQANPTPCPLKGAAEATTLPYGHPDDSESCSDAARERHQCPVFLRVDLCHVRRRLKLGTI